MEKRQEKREIWCCDSKAPSNTGSGADSLGRKRCTGPAMSLLFLMDCGLAAGQEAQSPPGHVVGACTDIEV